MRVSLFITCLVDQFHPEVGVAMVRVLERLGITCEFPAAQTCCGQPAFNTGCLHEATVVARQFLTAFEGAELIVAPSGSCTSMVRVHMPGLFAPGSADRARAERVAGRLYEFSEFLVKVKGDAFVGSHFPHRVAYHPSCHLLRELGVRDEPLQLLRHVGGLELVDLPAADTCCGFGGAFAVKYPEISEAMGREKLSNLERSGAEYLVANDTGCLMHLRGLLSRMGRPVRALHLAEVLAEEAPGV